MAKPPSSRPPSRPSGARPTGSRASASRGASSKSASSRSASSRSPSDKAARRPDQSSGDSRQETRGSTRPSRKSDNRNEGRQGDRRKDRSEDPRQDSRREERRNKDNPRDDSRRDRAPRKVDGAHNPRNAQEGRGYGGDKRGGTQAASSTVSDRRPARPPRKMANGSALPRAIATPKKPGEPQRIAKLLARAGIASRRDVERMIADGRIARDGVLIDTPATLLTSLHGITVDGTAVKEPAPAKLFCFHKPAGTLTAARDPKGRPTIYDKLPADLPRLMPIGRLDYNTEGLLLLTTDGELKRQMELPSSSVERTYRARAFGEISQTQLEDLVEGIEIDGIRYGKIDANLERRTGRNQWIELTLTEGKNREVRRVLEHFGLEVSRLIRTSYGPFQLADLPLGAVDQIRAHDLILFRKSLGGGDTE